MIIDEALDAETLADPLLFLRTCWPQFRLYDEQVRIVESVRDNVETYVPAGNMLGKDFVSGFIALWFFCSRSPARVLTSSVDYSQLKGVLWGEIRRFIDTSRITLGLAVNDLMIRQLRDDGLVDPRSELIGRVAKKGERMLGRHLERGPQNEPRTLAIIDEASGFEDMHYDSIVTWAHRVLIIGNPYPCDNFFKRGVKGGDVEDSTKAGAYFRKVIRIPASVSPNVRLAEIEQNEGRTPSGHEMVPGVMSWREYRYRRETWDKYKQTIGLDAQFYEGAEIKLYPPELLAEAIATHRRLGDRTRGLTMGVDTGEGGDSTVWTVCDERGVIEQVSTKTADTSVIPARTISLMAQYGVEASRVLFDSGGGGKEHVDVLRAKGYEVKAIAFGSSPTSADEFALFKRMPEHRREIKEDREVYRNRRAEMYGEASRVLRGVHPSGIGAEGFGLPAEYSELHRQLAVMPKLYDEGGKLYLPPKHRPTASYTGSTLVQMLGCSPDEADSFVLAVFGLVWTETQAAVGAMF